ncbi:hypothetical protein ABFT23_01765 [Nocardioides sp. C4-1]|uniref:hypothetical protein n=1 Tax=Nocardioides sp. C4-1 TaxID=3151851 RepID=UPI003263D014
MPYSEARGPLVVDPYLWSPSMRSPWVTGLAVALVVPVLAVPPLAPSSAAPSSPTSAPPSAPSSGRAGLDTGVTRGAPSTLGRLNPVPPVVVRAANGAVLPGALAAGRVSRVRVVDGHGVPAVGVSAVALQLTVRGGPRPGRVRVGAPTMLRRTPATVAFGAGDTVANQVVVPLDASGQVDVLSSAPAAVGLTVVGWLDSATADPDLQVLAAPRRVLDTPRRRPVTHRRDTVLDLRARARAPRATTAAVVQVSLTRATRDGFLTMSSTGPRRDRTPAVTFTRGRDVVQQVVVPLDARGRVAVRTSAGKADVDVDVVALVRSGRSPSAGGLHVLPRRGRVVDSRSRALTPFQAVPVRLSGRAGVPAAATAVTAVVTTVGGRRRRGDVALAPHVSVRDATPVVVPSRPRVNRSTVVTLPLGPRGAWTIKRPGSAHVVVDVVAYSVPPAAVVRPPARLVPTAPAVPDEPRRLASSILVGSTRYAMGTWWTTVLPGLLTRRLVQFSRPGPIERADRRVWERSVKKDPLADPARRIAMVAFGVAATLASGRWDDARIGVPAALGLQRLQLLVARLAAEHRSQRVDGWGGGWQGSLVAANLGRAAWLVWGLLPPATQQAVARAVVAEADDIAGRGPLYLRDRAGRLLGASGDSKAEESSWQAMVLQLATAMLPGHDHRPQWVHATTRSALGAWARPADVVRADVVNGLPLRSWLGGSNVEADGTVRNHSRVAPDYMAAVAQTLDQAWVQTLAGRPVPEAARALVGPTYAAYTTVDYPADRYLAPGGTIYRPDSAEIYYPEGIDWGPGLQMHYVLVDVQAATYGVGDPTTARTYALLHLRAAAAMQQRYPDGRTYAPHPEEFNYVGREELVSQLAGQTVLTQHVADTAGQRWTNAHWATQ